MSRENLKIAHDEFRKAGLYHDITRSFIKDPQPGEIYFFTCKDLPEDKDFFKYARRDGHYWRMHETKKIEHPSKPGVPMAVEKKYYRRRGRSNKKDTNCKKYLTFFPKTRMGMVHYVGNELEEDLEPHGNTKHNTHPFRPAHEIAKDAISKLNRLDSTRKQASDLEATLSSFLALSPHQLFYLSKKKWNPKLVNEILEMDLIGLSKNTHFKNSQALVANGPAQMVILCTQAARDEMAFIARRIKSLGLDELILFHVDTTFKYGKNKYVTFLGIRHPFLKNSTPRKGTKDERAIIPIACLIHKDRCVLSFLIDFHITYTLKTLSWLI